MCVGYTFCMGYTVPAIIGIDSMSSNRFPQRNWTAAVLDAFFYLVLNTQNSRVYVFIETKPNGVRKQKRNKGVYLLYDKWSGIGLRWLPQSMDHVTSLCWREFFFILAGLAVARISIACSGSGWRRCKGTNYKDQWLDESTEQVFCAELSYIYIQYIAWMLV